MSTTGHPRRWIVARHRISSEVIWLPIVWALFAVGVIAVAAIFATTGTVRTSAWEIASALPRWYIAGVGAYLTAVHLPLYIAHGFTRREFMAQAPIFMVVLVTVLSLLMTLGYAAEGFIYRLLGWPQSLAGNHLFASPAEFHLVLAEFWLLHFVWMAVATFVAAAFYRHGGLGVLALLFGIAMLATAESAVGPAIIGPFVFAYPQLREAAVAGAPAVTLALVAIALAGTWALVRDIPVRSRKS